MTVCTYDRNPKGLMDSTGNGFGVLRVNWAGGGRRGGTERGDGRLRIKEGWWDLSFGGYFMWKSKFDLVDSTWLV